MRQQSTSNKNKSLSSIEYRLILAFGSNLGNRELNLDCALKYISPYSKLVRCSKWHKTAPLISNQYDTSSHQYYINFVCEVVTLTHPICFYKNIIVPIEDRFGHCRKLKWQPRELDIDIVFAAKNDAQNFKNCTPIQLNMNGFQVPHNEYENREFWQKMIIEELYFDPKG